jgi:hypothetical protein
MAEAPVRKVAKALGLVQMTVRDVGSDAAEKSAGFFDGILALAVEKGANAVVNVRVVSGNDGNLSSYLVFFGDAVVLE